MKYFHIVLTITVIALIGLVIFFIFSRQHTTSSPPVTTEVQNTTTPSTSTEATSNEEKANKNVDFDFLYDYYGAIKTIHCEDILSLDSDNSSWIIRLKNGEKIYISYTTVYVSYSSKKSGCKNRKK